MALRWGILGTGEVAVQMATAIAFVGGKVTAVASRQLHKAQAFAAGTGQTFATDDYEALCRRDDVDIVYIALPHTLHCKMSVYAMKQGKHVLCEKPVAVNAAESRMIFVCAQETGSFFMEAVWTRFIPLLTQMLALANSGELGTVRLFKADFAIDTGVRCPRHRLTDPLVAGGALLDLGIYPLTVSAMLFGDKPEAVISDTRLQNGVDMENHMVLRYPSGARAMLYSGIAGTLPEEGCILCEHGYIRLHGFFYCTRAQVYRDGVITEHTHPFDCNGYEYQLRHVEQCIAQGLLQSPVMSHARSLEVMEIMDGLRAEWGLVYPCEKEM